jgi:hypothetical protein
VGGSDANGKSGVFGFNTTQNTGFSFGVFGLTPGGIGVGGRTEKFIGVHGVCVNTDPSNPGTAVKGDNENNGTGVEGTSVNGIGGSFAGGLAPLRLQPATHVGRPTSGNHQRGEFFVDSSGELFYCKDSGTPGNWFRVQLVPA